MHVKFLKVLDLIDDLPFKILIALRKSGRLRILVQILALLLGAFLGGALAGIPGILLGPLFMAVFYMVIIMLIQKPGFIQDDEGLFFGVLVGMFGGVGMFSLYAPLTFSNVVAMAIIGGALGFIYAKGNILYYQASEPL